MLIAAESLAHHCTEVLPTNVFKAVCNGLNPALGCTGELHCSDSNPHGLINKVHIKVGMGLSDPQLGVVLSNWGKCILGNWPRWEDWGWIWVGSGGGGGRWASATLKVGLGGGGGRGFRAG